MHGQKKRRERKRSGEFSRDGIRLCWELTFEPQWTSEDGYKGMCFSVRTEDRAHRELILEYPILKKVTGIGLPQIPQHPKCSAKDITTAIARAMDAGWEPMSRGKAFRFKVPPTETQ